MRDEGSIRIVFAEAYTEDAGAAPCGICCKERAIAQCGVGASDVLARGAMRQHAMPVAIRTTSPSSDTTIFRRAKLLACHRRHN